MEGNLGIKFIRKSQIQFKPHILKTYSNHVWKTTQKQVWVVASTLNDMCLIHVSAKSTQKSNKNQSPLLKVWNYELVQNMNFKWKFA